MNGRPSRIRSRVRTQWVALAAALVVLAGALVAWAITNAADRTLVVRAAQELRAGDVIQADHLSLTAVGFDPEVSGLVPAVSLDALVGRVATVDVATGSLWVAGMWRDAVSAAPGTDTVGAELQPGRFPAGLARGDVAWAAPTDSTLETPAVAVQIIDMVERGDGELSVTLAVPAAHSVAVARLAATDRLLLVGRTAGTDR